MHKIYDTHFHLDLQKDINQAIEEINKGQIYTIAVTNLPDLYRKEQMQVMSPYVRFALGFHPELLSKYKHQIPLMWELLPESRYIGEVGLDFSSDMDRLEQIKFFEDLISRCASDSNKIISIHSRKAVSTILDIIDSSYHFKPILHWFTGTMKELELAIERGFYFSINESMIHTNKGKNILSIIPPERLLLETDSPFSKEIAQRRSLEQTCAFLDPNNTGFLWTNFERMIKG